MHGFEVVSTFEETVARWAGADYGVAVESCSAALFLSCLYSSKFVSLGQYVHIPKYTYPSVPAAIIHAGMRVEFTDEKWKGSYELYPLNVWDSALRFRPNMHAELNEGSLNCISFHSKKHLPIGRGGMILTDDKEAVKWLKRMRFDGRDEAPLDSADITMCGWNFYMQPEQAARGLELFAKIKLRPPLPDLPVEEQGYPDLSKVECYR